MGDRELLVVSGKVPQRRGLSVQLAQALYGDGSSDAQLAHAGFLALLMCNIVGVYWLLRSLKDSVFTTVVGSPSRSTSRKYTHAISVSWRKATMPARVFA